MSIIIPCAESAALRLIAISSISALSCSDSFARALCPCVVVCALAFQFQTSIVDGPQIDNLQHSEARRARDSRDRALAAHIRLPATPHTRNYQKQHDLHLVDRGVHCALQCDSRTRRTTHDDRERERMLLQLHRSREAKRNVQPARTIGQCGGHRFSNISKRMRVRCTHN